MLSIQAERSFLALALAWPTRGPAQLANQLRRHEHGRLRVAPSTIYRLLRRMGRQPRWERLAVLEAHSAQAAELLTERTRRQLAAALWLMKAWAQPPALRRSEVEDQMCVESAQSE